MEKIVTIEMPENLWLAIVHALRSCPMGGPAGAVQQLMNAVDAVSVTPKGDEK